MCRYRKSIFLCNHTRQSTAPFVTCHLQQDYLAGSVSDPCETVSTHSCSTIRLPQLCPSCKARKGVADKRLSNVRAKIAEIRQQLEDKYGDNWKCIDEAGIKMDGVEELSKKGGDGKGDKKLDPVQEFLRSKRNEKYHMLSSS
ncbi:hypothetical protein F5Y10DRAFT_291859 [Nemania abortiva]|nr:hypothetical protein F5Y10DRAFT_291859 [Nemania abortiva]